MDTNDFETFEKALGQIDRKDNYNKPSYDYGDYKADFAKLRTDFAKYDKKAVLGLDIYHYSRFPLKKQTLIPFLFDLIYKEAIKLSVSVEPWLFIGVDFTGSFIPTGDGGFQIFKDPLQALIFNCQFHVVLRLYNALHFYPKLRKSVGNVELRSCVTFAKVFRYGNNYYGPALISNARILSRDRLNRMLIDEKSYKWFLKSFNGVEHLTKIKIQKLQEKLGVESSSKASVYFGGRFTIVNGPLSDPNSNRFIHIDCQKIGDLSVKESKLSIYNLHIQIYAALQDEENQSEKESTVVTIGNSSTHGISD